MPDGSAERKIIITMSLDLYIYSRRPVRHQGTGVFVRDNGQTRELKTIDEVQQHFPDADLSDIHVADSRDPLMKMSHRRLTFDWLVTRGDSSKSRIYVWENKMY